MKKVVDMEVQVAVKPNIGNLIPFALIAFFAGEIVFEGSAAHYLLGQISGVQARLFGLVGLCMGITGVWQYISLARKENADINRVVRRFCILYAACLMVPIILHVCKVPQAAGAIVTTFIVPSIIVAGAFYMHRRVCRDWGAIGTNPEE